MGRPTAPPAAAAATSGTGAWYLGLQGGRPARRGIPAALQMPCSCQLHLLHIRLTGRPLLGCWEVGRLDTPGPGPQCTAVLPKGLLLIRSTSPLRRPGQLQVWCHVHVRAPPNQNLLLLVWWVLHGHLLPSWRQLPVTLLLLEQCRVGMPAAEPGAGGQRMSPAVAPAPAPARPAGVTNTAKQLIKHNVVQPHYAAPIKV
jgi:hypothetical protein